MNREELEGALRRNLAETGVPDAYHDRLVDAFLPEADSYAESSVNRPRGARLVLTEKGERELAKWDAWRAQQDGAS